jgi:hypothetical protein
MYWGAWIAVAIGVDVLMAFIERLEGTDLLLSTYVAINYFSSFGSILHSSQFQSSSNFHTLFFFPNREKKCLSKFLARI